MRGSGTSGASRLWDCSVLRDVVMRVLLVRQSHRRDARIVLCRVDVKDAFRQVLVDPAGAPVSAYVSGCHVVVDLRLQFGGVTAPVFGVWLGRCSNILTLVPRSTLL